MEVPADRTAAGPAPERRGPPRRSLLASMLSAAPPRPVPRHARGSEEQQEEEEQQQQHSAHVDAVPPLSASPAPGALGTDDLMVLQLINPSYVAREQVRIQFEATGRSAAAAADDELGSAPDELFQDDPDDELEGSVAAAPTSARPGGSPVPAAEQTTQRGRREPADEPARSVSGTASAAPAPDCRPPQPAKRSGSWLQRLRRWWNQPVNPSPPGTPRQSDRGGSPAAGRAAQGLRGRASTTAAAAPHQPPGTPLHGPSPSPRSGGAWRATLSRGATSPAPYSFHGAGQRYQRDAAQASPDPSQRRPSAAVPIPQPGLRGAAAVPAEGSGSSRSSSASSPVPGSGTSARTPGPDALSAAAVAAAGAVMAGIPAPPVSSASAVSASASASARPAVQRRMRSVSSVLGRVLLYSASDDGEHRSGRPAAGAVPYSSSSSASSIASGPAGAANFGSVAAAGGARSMDASQRPAGTAAPWWRLEQGQVDALRSSLITVDADYFSANRVYRRRSGSAGTMAEASARPVVDVLISSGSVRLGAGADNAESAANRTRAESASLQLDAGREVHGAAALSTSKPGAVDRVSARAESDFTSSPTTAAGAGAGASADADVVMSGAATQRADARALAAAQQWNTVNLDYAAKLRWQRTQGRHPAQAHDGLAPPTGRRTVSTPAVVIGDGAPSSVMDGNRLPRRSATMTAHEAAAAAAAAAAAVPLASSYSGADLPLRNGLGLPTGEGGGGADPATEPDSLHFWLGTVIPKWRVVRNAPLVRKLWDRDGVPPELRGAVWPLALDARPSEMEPVYLRALERAEEVGDRTIASEVERSVEEAEFADGVRKVLGAFSVYAPEVSYVQGMSYLALLFLRVMPPHVAFASLVSVLRNDYFAAYVDFDVEEVRLRLRIFEVVFKANLPRLYRRFREIGVTADCWVVDHMMTLFTRALPGPAAARVFDMYLLHGEVVVFRCLVALLKLLRHRLWQASPTDCIRLLRGQHKVEASLLVKAIDSVGVPRRVVAHYADRRRALEQQQQAAATAAAQDPSSQSRRGTASRAQEQNVEPVAATAAGHDSNSKSDSTTTGREPVTAGREVPETDGGVDDVKSGGADDAGDDAALACTPPRRDRSDADSGLPTSSSHLFVQEPPSRTIEREDTPHRLARVLSQF